MSDPRYKNRPLSTDVTPAERRRLVRLMEECAELTVAASKILRFGPDNWHPSSKTRETNTAALRREIDDLLEAITDLGEMPPSGLRGKAEIVSEGIDAITELHGVISRIRVIAARHLDNDDGRSGARATRDGLTAIVGVTAPIANMDADEWLNGRSTRRAVRKTAGRREDVSEKA